MVNEVSAYAVKSCQHAYPSPLILYSVGVCKIDLGANELPGRDTGSIIAFQR